MAGDIEKRISFGLRRFAAVEGDLIVNRPPRRAITGVEFNNQFCRLLLDEPDSSGNDAYACKITDVSDEGFGIMCGAARTIPHPFNAGARLTLQESDGELVRVEVRWIKGGRLGVRRLSAPPAPPQG
jgi:hypothetical protein